MSGQHGRLSVVIPFYNEEESVEEVCLEVSEVLSAAPGLAWELIMVDDGSTDGTPGIVDGLATSLDNFRALHLSPNSGQSAALEAGFGAARGEFVATLDGDGQNDPRDILLLLGEFQVLQLLGVQRLADRSEPGQQRAQVQRRQGRVAVDLLVEALVPPLPLQLQNVFKIRLAV